MSYTLVLEWMPGDLYMSAVTARCTAPTSSYSVVWLPPNKVYQITLYCGSTSLVSFLVGAFRGKAWSYMNIFKKNTEKHTEKLPMTGKVKKGFRIYCTAVMGAALVLGTSVTAFAANDPITVINNLSTFIFGLIRAIGLILLGFGVVQVGLSLKSHDPSQRANGFLTLAGGVIITFAKEILDLIVG